MSRYAVGVDIGGTFTDFFAVDRTTQVSHTLKWPTDRDRPARGVLGGLLHLLELHAIQPAMVTEFSHGATIALNTVIERSGADLALLVTEGFRDVLNLRRLRMAVPVDFRGQVTPALVPRHRVLEVNERIMADGRVARALSTESVGRALDDLLAHEHLDGVVISLLHSFRFPDHESRLRDFAAQRWPELSVTCSHEIWPQMREYERTVASVLNAYVSPKVHQYLHELQHGLRELGISADLKVTKSNGGVAPASDGNALGVQTMLSGPASGTTAAAAIAASCGLEKAITLDVGGTSADIAVITQDGVVTSTNTAVSDLPMPMPVIEITAVGAGGGSIAFLDPAGVLRVGPESAGAEPGPACYGRGGERPTLTDAFLLTGIVSATALVGSNVRLREDLAEGAVRPLAEALGLTVQQAASAIIKVSRANMHRGIKGVLARHGLDPGEVSLIVFGGAGPAVAAGLAEDLGVVRVVIPGRPGVLCAAGAAMGDIKGDFIASVMEPLEAAQELIVSTIEDLTKSAEAWLAEVGSAPGERLVEIAAEMRYPGQWSEIRIPLDAHKSGGTALTESMAERFHAEHQRLYAHSDPDVPPEVVSLRATAIERTPPLIIGAPQGHEEGEPASDGVRRVDFGSGATRTPVLRRGDLSPGDRVHGPAIVEQSDTTVALPPSWTLLVDGQGNLTLNSEKR